MWAKDVIAEYGPNLIRWFLLSARYRDSLIYDDDTFNTAKVELNKITNALKQAELKLILNDVDNREYDEEKYKEFLNHMNDDLNTPNAYMVIFDTIKLLNQNIRTKDIDFAVVSKYYNAIRKMLDILGIEIDRLEMTEEDKTTYNLWNQAKIDKDFEKADEYRAILTAKGII